MLSKMNCCHYFIVHAIRGKELPEFSPQHDICPLNYHECQRWAQLDAANFSNVDATFSVKIDLNEQLVECHGYMKISDGADSAIEEIRSGPAFIIIDAAETFFRNELSKSDGFFAAELVKPTMSAK